MAGRNGSTMRRRSRLNGGKLSAFNLGEFAKTEDDVRRVLRTVEETIDMMLLMYDDMYRRVTAIQ